MYFIYKNGKKHKSFYTSAQAKEFLNVSEAQFFNLLHGKTNNTNGYTVRKAAQGSEPISVSFSGEFRNKKSKKYLDKIFALDIETSQYTSADGRPFSVSYLCGVKGCDFSDMNLTVEHFIKKNKNYQPFRTWQQVNDWLVCLNNQCEKIGKNAIVFIHNFAYEFSFFQNIPFFIENFKNENLMAIKARQPFKLSVKNIEFRCSFKLLGCGLKAAGERIGLPKLENEKGGYAQHFTPESYLPEVEYKYNERDLDITLYAVLQTFKAYGAKNVNDISTILTATGITRAKNKNENTQETRKNFATFCKKQAKNFNDIIDDQKVFEFLEHIFTGGFVRGSMFDVFKPYRNVMSFDIKSSYPTFMLNRYFPYNFKIVTEDKTKEFLKLYGANILYYYERKEIKSQKCKDFEFDDFTNFYMRTHKTTSKVFFLARVILNNVHVKEYANKNMMPLLSSSKVDILDYTGLSIDNGRVLKCKQLAVYVSDVDFLALHLTYDFDICECTHLMESFSAQPINKYVKHAVESYAIKKDVFKRLSKKDVDYVTENDFLYNSEFIITHNEFEIFKNMPESEKVDYISTELRGSKSDLNAQYGINVQKIAMPILSYDPVTNEWKETRPENADTKNILRNYIYGIYITAYARLHLVALTHLLYKKTDCKILYWDTDSAKVYSKFPDTVKLYVNRFNAALEKGWRVHNRFGFGVFEFEETYDYFAQAGAKNYIYIKDGSVTVSISGVPKRKASAVYTELFKNSNSPEEFFKEWYHPNIVITGEKTGKLSAYYYTGDDNIFDEIITDDYGNKYHFKGYSGAVLIPADYTLWGINDRHDLVKIKRAENATGMQLFSKPVFIGEPTEKVTEKLTKFADIIDERGLF